MIFIAILAHHTILTYAYKSKLNFLQDAMIFCSLVEIITKYTHTHTQIYKETNLKKIFFSVNLPQLLIIHCVSDIQETTSNLLYDACIFTHTHNKHHLYIHTIIQKYNLCAHTHTHKELYTILMFFWQYFSISSLSDNCCL